MGFGDRGGRGGGRGAPRGAPRGRGELVFQILNSMDVVAPVRCGVLLR